MGQFLRVIPVLVGAVMLNPLVQASAQSPGVSARVAASASDIEGALRGKLCTTRAGAKFTFSRDMHYSYDGLWKNRGHYAIKDGAVTVSLDNGLVRDFAISRAGKDFYMEETAITCAAVDPDGAPSG